MFSRDDRRRLEAIEQDLQHDDPQFVARMNRPHWTRETTALLGTVIALELIAAVTIGIALGWPAATSMIPVIVVSALLVRHAHTRRSRSPHIP